MKSLGVGNEWRWQPNSVQPPPTTTITTSTVLEDRTTHHANTVFQGHMKKTERGVKCYLNGTKTLRNIKFSKLAFNFFFNLEKVATK